MRRYSAVLSFLGVAIAAAARAQPQEPPPQFNPPKNYYLALGDSITYGYQQFKALAGLPPSAFNTGYVDVFGARLREIQPGIIIVNYSCPGESTQSFVDGNCIWTQTGHLLHDSYSGTQLQAALEFLAAHPGQVSPISLSLFSNDLPMLLGPCTFNGQIDPACVQNHVSGFIEGLTSRISAILSQLRSEAPNSEIIVIGGVDEFLNALSFADPLYQVFNAALAQTAAANRVRFVDPFPIFNPQGDLSREIQTICALTLLCRDGDGHPSDAGYQALAALIYDASDYIKLQNERP
jgi:lysophospholipase L1-like esterase